MPRTPLSSLAHLLLSRRMSGPAISTVLRLLQGGPAVRLIAQLVQQQIGVADLRGLDMRFRTEVPLSTAPIRARPHQKFSDARLGPLPLPRSWPRSAAVLHDAYTRARTDPSAVLSHLQQGAARLDLHHRRSPVLHKAPGAEPDAAAATAAYRDGRPLSPLCGVPVAVKEEVAVAGLPLRLGTSFLPDDPSPADATLVARLRKAGAIISFSAPMTEYGLSPFGVSAQRTLPYNPHARGHSAGGSSTGPAVAVATGLCPLAIGTDGGGSVRIPSSLCGVFGLKPTFGRLSRTGDPYGGTMDHLGPLGASVADLAALLSVTAGPDPDDPATAFAPPNIPNLQDQAHDEWSEAIGRGVKGLRIGLCDRLWQRCDADVAHACMVAVDRLCQEGAERVAIDLPLSAHAAAIGYLTFGMELLAALRTLNPDPHRVGPDLRLSLTFLAQFPPDSYIDAQRLRGGLRLEARDALRAADVLALPTTAVVAPPLTETEMEGLVDLELVDALVRFTFLGNLTGLPALSAPVGLKDAGTNHRLPIGLQLYGDAWDEATVLATAAHLERIGAARVERPPIAVDLLTGES